MYLRWGLRWGLLWGVAAGSVKVVSDTPPTDTMGSSSMTAASLVLPCAFSSPATSVSIGSVADGSDDRKREKSQANIQKENQKKKNPREVFKQEDYLY